MGAAVAEKPSRFVSPEGRRAIGGGARAEKAKRRFAEFVDQGWHVLEGGQLEWNVYILALCEHLQALFEGWLVANGKANARQRANVIAHWQRQGLTFREGHLLVQNMVINMPPGTLKSRILMVFFPAWVWLHAPGFSFACASSNDENVLRDSDAHQDLVTSEWYRDSFGVKWELRHKTSAVKRWSTTANGLRISRTILAGFVGIHVDAVLIDDPDDPLRVFNEPERRRVHFKWTKAIENRVNHELRSIRVVAQQRVHAEDLTGYITAQSRWAPHNRAGWMSFVVPLEGGKAPGDLPEETAFGWRDRRPKPAANDNAPSVVMDPGRFPPEVIADKRRKLGSHGFESQYNQNPEALSGGWFSRGWFRFFKCAPDPTKPQLVEPPPRPRPDGCTLEETYVLERDHRGALVLDWLTITVDASFGSLNERTASAVGLLVVGGRGLMRFVFDDRTDVMSFLGTIDAVKALVRMYGARKALIEIKANGPALIEKLQKAMTDGEIIGPDGKPIAVVIEGWNPGQDSKHARARAMMPDFEAGTIFLLEGALWLDAFLKELCVFPNAPRDDRVDAMSQLMAYYSAANDEYQRARAMARW